eukprot:3447682-Alexandrium_andersonii.AAC.1
MCIRDSGRAVRVQHLATTIRTYEVKVAAKRVLALQHFWAQVSSTPGQPEGYSSPAINSFSNGPCASRMVQTSDSTSH